MSAYDLIIVGAGPAGITAAVYAARKMLNVLVLSKDIGGQAAWSSEIQNYTGYQFISGPELVRKFDEHLRSFKVELKVGVEVTCIDSDGESFKVKTGSGVFESKAVIIATGRRPKLLRAVGEAEYKNRGVTYCATCDAPLFSGKDVVVVGGGNSALDAALQLLPIANRVYLMDISDHIIGDSVLIEKLKASGKVEMLLRTELVEIFGDRFVRGVKVLVNKKEERTIPVEGVFIEIGSSPAREPACKAKINEHGEIIVDDRCQTSIRGLFAAGDVTSIPEKQIIAAAGQGCIASLTAFKYLSKISDRQVR